MDIKDRLAKLEKKAARKKQKTGKRCDICSYADPVGGLKRIQVTEDDAEGHDLCLVCQSTGMGTRAYPQDEYQLRSMIAWIGNRLREDIADLETELP